MTSSNSWLFNSFFTNFLYCATIGALTGIKCQNFFLWYAYKAINCIGVTLSKRFRASSIIFLIHKMPCRG